MSTKHLAKGSTLPPKVDGKLRLYSMQYCPFAQRVCLVLLVKGVPHDIVNIHLKNKPDWIYDLHPEGKVPILDIGSKKIIESLDISGYLDEQYPEPPLYPKDPQKRQLDKDLIAEGGDLIMIYLKALYARKNKLYSEYMKEILVYTRKLESELEKRGLYFGGDKPGMIDYMFWPWGERAEVLALAFNEKLPSADEFPRLYSWWKAMRTQKAVQETETSTERLFKIYQQYMGKPEDVDYDAV